MLGDFLEHLEQERGNGARSRNVRLAAIHSFFRCVAFRGVGGAVIAAPFRVVSGVLGAIF
ncbi:MAG: hypothetical protein WAM94_12890 [Chromatiaceae bacterium]